MKARSDLIRGKESQFRRMGAEMVDNLLQNLPGLVYRCLYDKKWTMKYISDGCRVLSGYQPEELLDNAILSYDDLILPEDRQYVSDEISKAVERNQPFTLVYRIRTKSSAIRWAWEQGRAVPEKGKPVYLDGYITDVTEQKETEEKLKEMAEKLAEANHLKDRLFTIIAHNLRNPVYAVISLVDFISENLQTLSAIDIKEIFNQVQLSVRATHTILENLLEWVQIQMDDYYVHNENIDVTKLILDMIKQFRNQAEERGVNIVFKQYQEIRLYADSVLITSIIRNLLSNAIKFTAMGGRVTVYIRRTREGIYLSVTDTGIGISRRNQASLFELGWVGFDGEMANENGCGIGLVLVKDVLNILGGEIKVESKLGKGSSFVVSIPDQPVGEETKVKQE